MQSDDNVYEIDKKACFPFRAAGFFFGIRNRWSVLLQKEEVLRGLWKLKESWCRETGWRLNQVRNPNRNPNPRNPKPETGTRNPKPETGTRNPNPEPRTRKWSRSPVYQIDIGAGQMLPFK
ncbi:Uncharacterised protein [Chlamydia abortus]|nr:Uncharacterised protein [Chlamydia abortus]